LKFSTGPTARTPPSLGSTALTHTSLRWLRLRQRVCQQSQQRLHPAVAVLSSSSKASIGPESRRRSRNSSLRSRTAASMQSRPDSQVSKSYCVRVCSGGALCGLDASRRGDEEPRRRTTQGHSGTGGPCRGFEKSSTDMRGAVTNSAASPVHCSPQTPSNLRRSCRMAQTARSLQAR
jgi:hypothetical protein